MTDASSKIDVRRLKGGGGGFTNTNITIPLVITRSSIPRSQSVMIIIPVTRQRRYNFP